MLQMDVWSLLIIIRRETIGTPRPHRSNGMALQPMSSGFKLTLTSYRINCELNEALSLTEISLTSSPTWLDFTFL